MHEQKAIRKRASVATAPFAMLPGAVVLDGSISHGARTLYSFFLLVSIGKAQSWYAQGTMARAFGVTDRTIRTWEEELEARGLIEIESGRLEGRPSVIWIADIERVYPKEKLFSVLDNLPGTTAPPGEGLTWSFNPDPREVERRKSAVGEGSEENFLPPRKKTSGGVGRKLPTEVEEGKETNQEDETPLCAGAHEAGQPPGSPVEKGTPGEGQGTGGAPGTPEDALAPVCQNDIPAPSLPRTSLKGTDGGKPLAGFREAAAGGSGAVRRAPSRSAGSPKAYDGSTTLAIFAKISLTISAGIPGARLGTATGKDLALVKKLVEAFGEEQVLDMAGVFTLDFAAAKDKFRLSSELPSIALVWAYRRELSLAVTSKAGLVTPIHRFSKWAKSKGLSGSGSDSVWGEGA